jgi:hypothetical protein
MNKLKKAAVIMAFGASVFASQVSAVTAIATTTVTINWPDVLILYTFSEIDITPDADILTNNLGAGTLSTCESGSDNDHCVDAGTSNVTMDALTEDLDIAGDADVPLDANLSNITITLENAIGARSLGVTAATYTLVVTDEGDSDAINLGTSQATSFTNSGLTLTTADLIIELDVSEIAAADNDSEDFEISVSGV